MGSLIVARSRNQWGSIVVDVGCPRDESHRLGDVAPPFFQSLNGWRSASFADQSLSDLHRGNGIPRRQTAQNRRQARNGLRVKAFLRSGPPLCDLENTYFRSPFWLDIGISQTKSGSSLLALRDWRGEGQWGNSTLAKW